MSKVPRAEETLVSMVTSCSNPFSQFVPFLHSSETSQRRILNRYGHLDANCPKFVTCHTSTFKFLTRPACHDQSQELVYFSILGNLSSALSSSPCRVPKSPGLMLALEELFAFFCTERKSVFCTERKAGSFVEALPHINECLLALNSSWNETDHPTVIH